MIESVELVNFISHSENKINFEDGVTVFVGDNGAGKSSVIDAITFALFGEHARKSNKSLIRRGTSQAYVSVDFTANGRAYRSIRKIDAKGGLVAQFFEKKDGQTMLISDGERRQFGESTTDQISSRLGLDFTKLKVASIVQQGELASIIKAKPKEFKELLNAIIGIDKLDLASENLKVVQKNFRDSIRHRLGYDDTHMETLREELDEDRQELKKAGQQREELQKRKQMHETELEEIGQRILADSQRQSMRDQLEQRKQEFYNHIKEAIGKIKNEIAENESKIAKCQGCFELASMKKDFESRLVDIEAEMNDTVKKIQEREKNLAALSEQLELSKKLVLQNGRCPVCDSEVSYLKPVYQTQHIKTEQEKIRGELDMLSTKEKQLGKTRDEISTKLKMALVAKTTLDNHAIHRPEQLDILRTQVATQRAQIQKVQTGESGLLIDWVMDSSTKLLYENIQDLEKQVAGFDQAEFAKIKASYEQKRAEASKIDQQYGAVNEKIKYLNHRTEKITVVLAELDKAKNYLGMIEQIGHTYSRDGPVATSIRSWALNTIALKTSEYLEMLNTKIHRISLAEKTRDVSITCYSKNTPIDIDSLSGGEQISVSLALRLGMAQLLGTSSLDFMILDEPTTHLDSERRRALVRVLSQLSDISGAHGHLQFIIITHDAEIFDDSAVEKIYKFESTDDGTLVTLL